MFKRLLLSAFVLAATGASYASSSEQVAMDSPVEIKESWTYVDCGSSSDPMQIDSIEVSPDPPKPGADLTVKVKGTVTETIAEGAYADVTVKLGLIKLLTKRFDACEEARNANTTIQCPVKPDEYTVEHTVALPKEIPQAKFLVQVRGYTADDDDMMCLDLKVDFMKHRFW